MPPPWSTNPRACPTPSRALNHKALRVRDFGARWQRVRCIPTPKGARWGVPLPLGQPSPRTGPLGRPTPALDPHGQPRPPPMVAQGGLVDVLVNYPPPIVGQSAPSAPGSRWSVTPVTKGLVRAHPTRSHNRRKVPRQNASHEGMMSVPARTRTWTFPRTLCHLELLAQPG